MLEVQNYRPPTICKGRFVEGFVRRFIRGLAGNVRLPLCFTSNYEWWQEEIGKVYVQLQYWHLAAASGQFHVPSPTG
jgi:hypothetical protein